MASAKSAASAEVELAGPRSSGLNTAATAGPAAALAEAAEGGRGRLLRGLRAAGLAALDLLGMPTEMGTSSAWGLRARPERLSGASR